MSGNTLLLSTVVVSHSAGRGGSPAWLAVAGLCFLVVLAGVPLGNYEITA